MRREYELIDRLHFLKLVSAVDKRPRVPRKTGRIARNGYEQGHIAGRQFSYLRSSTRAGRVKNDRVKSGEFGRC